MEAKLAFDLFEEFLNDGFDVLKIPDNDRLICRPGITMVEDKVLPVHIFEDKKKIILLPQLFEFSSYGQDNPTSIRILAYSTANRWNRYLKKGTLTNETKEDIVTAWAIATIKGLQLCGSKVFDDEFYIVKQKIQELTGLNVSRTKFKCKKEIKEFVTVNNDTSLEEFSDNILRLIDGESISNKPLLSLKEGDFGSRTNPFENIDDAANYIIELEKKRLEKDAFRNYINDLPFFVDISQRSFRIPWAGAYCSYLNGPNVIQDGFVVNQLLSRRFNLKPCLYNHKFLFRGQSEFYSPCVPNMFRKGDEDYFLKYTIFTCEMQLLLQSHPLVRLFEEGIELFNDSFRFEINYGGLSQHYYNRTQFLDLTSDIEAAKFFGVTTFDFSNNKYIPYNGDSLGVLYYYDIEPDALVLNKNNGYQLSAIGKQPFMRSGAQHGYLLAMEKGLDFNLLPQVRYVFFKHNPTITQRIYESSRKGELYQTEDILQYYWYNKLTNKDEKQSVSMEAVELNRKHNPNTSKTKLLKRLRAEGISVNRNGIPKFSSEDLDKYYFSQISEYWDEFCKDIYFYSPEGRVLHKHLLNLPKNKRYRDYFVK